jgi:hypothetical protein
MHERGGLALIITHDSSRGTTVPGLVKAVSRRLLKNKLLRSPVSSRSVSVGRDMELAQFSRPGPQQWVAAESKPETGRSVSGSGDGWLLWRIAFQAARIYWPLSHPAFFFVLFKIRLDPFHAWILREGPIRSGDRLLDLGSGKCILLASIRAACASFKEHRWPAHWPAPPEPLGYTGVDLHPGDADLCEELLSKDQFIRGDLFHLPKGIFDVVTLIDVLQYIPRDAQVPLLAAIRKQQPNAILLIRVADDSLTLRHRLTLMVDWINALVRGTLAQPLGNTRSAAEWGHLLKDLGYALEIQPLYRGTFFSNTLFLARPEKA